MLAGCKADPDTLTSDPEEADLFYAPRPGTKATGLPTGTCCSIGPVSSQVDDGGGGKEAPDGLASTGWYLGVSTGVDGALAAIKREGDHYLQRRGGRDHIW